MKTAYSIHNWSLHFETPESLKRVRAGAWVPIPNKHEGRGYRRIMAEADGRTIYGTWIALVQSASKMPMRGLLADHDGPIYAEDLATKIMATKEEVERAIEVVTSSRIGWLDEIEWDENSSFDENVARLTNLRQRTSFPVRRDGNPSGVTEIRQGKTSAEALQPSNEHDGNPSGVTEIRQGKSRTPAPLASPQGLQSAGIVPLAENSSSVEALQPSNEHDGNPSGVTEIRQACGKNRLQYSTGQNRTGQDRTEQDRTLPPAVPQGGQSAGSVTISIPALAKKLICEKILGGKDPGRPWSYQAQERLSNLCGAGGLPLREIEEIAAYRAIPKSDDIPELKARRDPITETSLMEYWGDEAQRAHAYLEKYHPGRNGSVQKKEPVGWEDFFRWKYDKDCVLPSSFWELDDDQQVEWQRDHEEFERSREQSATMAV